MSFELPPQTLGAIRRNISASLADTFQMMFQMDIFLMPDFKDGEDNQAIYAYMEMTHEASKAYLTIAITRVLVEHIGDQLKPGISAHAPELMQDIVCEITNIVGNHLRSYLLDKIGIECAISLPRGGQPPADGRPRLINLHFRIRDNDSIDLDFCFGT